MASKSKKKSSKRMKSADMDVEDFMAAGFDSDSSDSDSGGTSDVVQTKPSENKSVKLQGKNAKSEFGVSQHKVSLEKLKQKDPAFYKFLQREDQELLQFDESDLSESEEDEDSEIDPEDDPIHRPPETLEAMSDSEGDTDSSEEEQLATSNVKDKRNVVTLKMVSRWSKALQEASTPFSAIHDSASAFKASVQQVKGDTQKIGKYQVKGSAVFNAIVRLCITDMVPALHKVLKLPQSKDPKKPVLPSTSKTWQRVKSDVKSYLLDLMQLLSEVAEPAISAVLLKHLHQIITFYACFPKLCKMLLKKLLRVWSTAEETTRVLAFLCIIRLVRIQQVALLEICLKQMYMAYVKNCKFTSPSTLPVINFMQRSMIEMFSIDVALTYKYAFVYIRQLAIHLRNAITLKKKDTCQAVYNWQFIHSLHLWARLLSQLHSVETLQPLIYPLTQVIIGTIRLVPTARYYPLRFHCVRALNILSDATGTYIPVLPLLTEIFESTDFNKKHKHVSFKPFNFACMLKLSNSQLDEKAFREGVIDQLYEHLMDQLNIHSHCIGFPELALPAIVQMKAFLKKCKVANFTKQIKQIVDRSEETIRVITQRRKSSSLNLADTAAVTAWEIRSKQEGTPIGKYFATWRRMRDRELQYEIAGKERISIDGVPTMERRKGPPKATDEDRKDFGAMFDSDGEDSGDDETRFLLKAERPVKKQKTTLDDSDDYSDFDDDELERLARSASEDEGSVDEEDLEVDDESSPEDESEQDEQNNGNKDAADIDISGSDLSDVVEDFELSSDED